MLRHLGLTVPPWAVLWLCSGCTSQQLIALKDRDIRDLRQQSASRQEALVKALRTIETLREELNTTKYEQRELERRAASASASIDLQQETIERLEAQKAKLAEKLRQSEIAYERLNDTYLDLKSVLGTTVTELAETRRVHRAAATAGLDVSSTSEGARLKRRVDELRQQVIRERAARRLASDGGGEPLGGVVEPGARVQRLTDAAPPPGLALVELPPHGAPMHAPQGVDAGASSGPLLARALLVALGAIPAAALGILLFVIGARRGQRRSAAPGADAADGDETEYAHEDTAHEAGRAAEEDAERLPGEPGIHEFAPRGRSVGAAAGAGAARPGLEPQHSTRRDGSSPPDKSSVLDTLDWLNDVENPSKPPQRHPAATESLGSLAGATAQASDASGAASGGRSETSARRASSREDSSREDRPPFSDTQAIADIGDGVLSSTQVLPSLESAPAEDDTGDTRGVDGTRNEEFKETAILPEELAAESRSASDHPPAFDETLNSDTQIMPTLDFRDGDPIVIEDVLVGAADRRASELVEDPRAEKELVEELEELMGERFEEHAR